MMLPNAPVKVAAAPLYRRTGAATSYGLIAGSAATRLISLPGESLSAAGPLLAMVFLGLVALDANYTRQGGINQNRAAADAHAKLKAAQESLAAMTDLPEQLRQQKQQELAEDMSKWLHEHPALRRQVMTACDTLVDIDNHARTAAANTAKVQIHQADLASWRAAMEQRLERLRKRLGRHQTKRLQRRIGELEDRIRMYDTLGPEALKAVYVNLSATQAKQVRDVYLYSVAAATAGPAQVISAVNTFGQIAGTVAAPAEAMMSAMGLGLIASGVSVFSNYIDGWKDAPRELKRASHAKHLTQLQMSALADAQSRAASVAATADGPAGMERKATEKALGAMMRNRVRRHQEFHRLTNQAWIRRIKGWIGAPLGILNGLSTLASIGVAAAAVTAGILTMGYIAIPLAVAGIGLTVFFVASVSNMILFQRKQKDAMRVDEAVARLFMANHSRESLMKVMASQKPSFKIDTDRMNALQLSDRVRKALQKRLEQIRQKPALLQSNPYLGALVMADQWLKQLTMAAPEAADATLTELPRRLGVPEVQIMRIRAMIRTGQPTEQVTAAAQKALLASIELELKIHDTLHPDTEKDSATPVITTDRSTLDNRPLRAWEAIDDSPTRPGSLDSWEARAASSSPSNRPVSSISTHKPLQARDIQKWLGPLTYAAVPARTTSAIHTIESQAWSLVWTTIKEDSRPGRSRPGGRWRRANEVLAQWDKDQIHQAKRQQRIRQQLKERIEETIRLQSLPAIEVTDKFLDRILSAASLQAEAIGRSLPVDTGPDASALTPAVRQHYSDVGQLARQLTTGP
ncbi:hypothetical protein [uncultured Hydrogenophaga sp.]|uniref:hypothetical protein n=1 Tax=uncultured Hydrogenophaga sp. TaxID=199683 RepID=UPI00265DEA98|nr:hypothetical protein [uncultured Hydrogenophaga sp.]